MIFHQTIYTFVAFYVCVLVTCSKLITLQSCGKAEYPYNDLIHTTISVLFSLSTIEGK